MSSEKPIEPSAETSIFVGTFRRPLMDWIKEARTCCPTCERPWKFAMTPNVEAVMVCWQLGHLDVSVYKSIEEVIRLQKPIESPVLVKPPEPKASTRRTMWPEDKDERPAR